jgi:mediator of RNA polymerase II transcription subunit 10
LNLIVDLFFGFSLIDDGKNPDEFTKDVINNCIAKNQITKGKTDALKVGYNS